MRERGTTKNELKKRSINRRERTKINSIINSPIFYGVPIVILCGVG